MSAAFGQPWRSWRNRFGWCNLMKDNCHKWIPNSLSFRSTTRPWRLLTSVILNSRPQAKGTACSMNPWHVNTIVQATYRLTATSYINLNLFDACGSGWPKMLPTQRSFRLKERWEMTCWRSRGTTQTTRIIVIGRCFSLVDFGRFVDANPVVVRVAACIWLDMSG